MLRKSSLTLLWLAIALSVFSQNMNYIRTIVPDRDTTAIAARFQRLNASTMPGSTIAINGTPYKVYASGAFAAYIPLKQGLNQLVIESVHPKFGKISRTLFITSKTADTDKEVSDFSIEYARTVPPVSQSLVTGDVLQVRMKALPGCQALFFGNHPMYELPESQSGGIKGIYQGTYRIQPGDTLNQGKIDFTLLRNYPDNHTDAVHDVSVSATTNISRTDAVHDVSVSATTNISRTDAARDVSANATTNKPNTDAARDVSANIFSINTGDFPAVGQTTGTFPYLNYGLGEDRLGGARAGYLDSLVLLNLTGKTGDFYRVQLSESQTFFIPAEQVRLLPKGTFTPYSLADSWSVTGDDRYDYLRIGLSRRLPYLSRYESHPSRIVLDIFGAVSNTNWITQLTSAKEIKNVWYEQPEKNVMRVTMELNHQQPWGYQVYYENNRLTVRVKKQPELLSWRNLKIGLDAGHGGSNMGALGSTGVEEKVINLAVVRKMKAALEKLGARIVLTRQEDETLSTTDRWLIWQKAEPDLVLSFHCNSIGNSDPLKVMGTSTYYKYVAFRPLSEALYAELLKTGLSEFGNIGSFNFLLNAPTQFPNALIEIAFMSNPEDEMKLLDPAFQDKIVASVIRGLEKFLKQSKQ